MLSSTINMSALGCPQTATRRCCIHAGPVRCTPDAVATAHTSSSSSSHTPVVERPARQQQLVAGPVSQLSAVHLQDVWPSQSAPQVDRVTRLQPQQQQQQQLFTQKQGVPRSPLVAPGTNSPVDANSPGAGSHAPPVLKQQQRARHRQQQKPSLQQQARQQQQQQQLLQLQAAAQRAPVPYTPCGKHDVQKLAASISQRVRKGRQVLLPAGAGMQLVRNTAMLASARTLLLSHSSSTGLVFQPSFSTAAAVQQPAVKQQQAQHKQAAADNRATSSDGTSTSGRSTGTSKGVMLLVSAVPEAQLRRFDQQPLVAARSTRAAALARAMFARLCKQGFASVRAAGPEASRLAVLAAAEVRSKLLGCGLDVAVVPATEFVDVDSLAGPEGPPQYVEVDAGDGQEGFAPGEQLPKQFVRVTVLHLVRCEPQQPWSLLPWAVPAAQLPAARHGKQQQQQRQPQWQQQPVMDEGVLVAAAAAAVSTQRREQQGAAAPVGVRLREGRVQPQQQQQQQQQYQPPLQNNSVSSSGLLQREAVVGTTAGLQDAVASSVAAAQRLQAALLPADDVVVGSGSIRTAKVLLSAEQSQALQLQQQQQQQQDALDAAGGVAAAATGSSAMAAGRPGGLLLQHKQQHKKGGSRQLVAAAQAAGSGIGGLVQ